MKTMLWAALLIFATGIAGCKTTKDIERKEYDHRESAMKLIDEGRQLAATGQPMLALARFDRSTKIYPVSGAWYEMGRIYEAMGQREHAAAAYNEALKLTPEWREPRFAMLALGFQPPKPASADEIREARRWAAANPVRPITLTADETVTAPLTAEQAQAKRQELIKNAAENRKPTEAEVAAAIFTGNGQPQGLPSAEKPVYERGKELIIGSYPYHMERARSFARRGQSDLAADEYLRAMQIDPKQIDPRLEIGDMMMKLERYPQAQFHYEEAGRQFPASPKPDLKLGILAMKMKDNDTAGKDFRDALQKDPKNTEAFNNLAVIAMQGKDYPEAARLLNEALTINPNYTSALLNRGLIADEIEKNHPLALKLFRRYVELNGPRAGEVRNWIQDLEAGQK
ncbi:tetratricopeptide repeat protein [bacterium]|nr:tetratricopeptide repeat protein [bacterium]